MKTNKNIGLFKGQQMEIITKYAFFILGLLLFSSAQAAAPKPNILVIWGDDIGQSRARRTPTGKAAGGYPL